MDKIITIKFSEDETKLLPLLWNSMYGSRTGIPASQLRIHNSILDELEKLLDVGFETEPVYEVLQMTQGTTTLAIHRINADVSKAGEINLELNHNQFDYLKVTLSQTNWMPAVSRLAEKLFDKFSIGD